MFGQIESQASLAKYPTFEQQVRPLAGAAACKNAAAVAESQLEHFGALYGACVPMRKLFAKIERLARSTASVIILGESGSGKELVATTLHQLSHRADQPFIAVNCGAVAENLIESELFGHERGSFTGASRTHRGCFERASGGTLFLDEITEMSIDMQVRLLRVLETGRFCRVGGDNEISTDVRVLAASNRDLQQAVASGRLREDLMYRLCVIPLTVPPLRDRDDDALLLADMFLRNLNDEHEENKRLSHRAKEQILEYRWPGNVRELKNVVHRAFVLSDDEVSVDMDETARPEHAPQPRLVSGGTPSPSAFGESFAVRIPVGMSLDNAEKALITATLKAVSGSKSKAAQVLGISLKTLYNRLHAYDDAAAASKPPSNMECAALAA
jgi:two-component system, NtrC family, response regulator HydG